MKKYIDGAMTYAEYIKLIDDLLLEGKTTGQNQSEAMYNYGKLNRQRIHRLEKTADIGAEFEARLGALNVNWTWLVITEGWCGDAAQNIPLIEKIAAENPGIRTRYILRDENVELIDQYLTDGARSIPKLLAIDNDTGEVIGTWGARPQAAQAHYLELKNAGREKAEIMESLQRWYNADKNQSIQQEFDQLIGDWTSAPHTAAVGV